VYDSAEGGSRLGRVSAELAVLSEVLVISAAGDDLDAATYYVSFTERGKTESACLALTVEPYTEPWQSSRPAALINTVTKTDYVQKSAAFLMRNSIAGRWKVYLTETGGESVSG
jgi:hypothetical protein